MIKFSGVLYIDAEKVKGKGEDAQTFKFDENGNGYMFVFDGCGGAGSEKHMGLCGVKSAYAASRSAAFFIDNYVSSHNIYDTVKLGRELYSFLVEVNSKYPMETSVSTLVDILPTTISGVLIRPSENGISARFIWAGDSRGYIIDEKGLSQVTEDDVTSKDAYSNLFDDSIMSNRMHGNPDKNAFLLRHADVKLGGKSIFICATDGCYDYFNSPMVFEFFVVTMLYSSKSFSEAEEKLKDVLREKSGDDCSLTAAFYGFEDYGDIKSFLKSRFEYLDADKDNFSESYWNEKYKQNYYRYNRQRCSKIAEN